MRLETENKTVSTHRFQNEVLDYQCHAKGIFKTGFFKNPQAPEDFFGESYWKFVAFPSPFLCHHGRVKPGVSPCHKPSKKVFKRTTLRTWHLLLGVRRDWYLTHTCGKWRGKAVTGDTWIISANSLPTATSISGRAEIWASTIRCDGRVRSGPVIILKGITFR